MIKPLVSILIPCYNHEKFLADCLNSIINQDYENIEFFICDDASSDSSYEKIEEFREKLETRFNRVVILKNELNLGVTKNINRMLELAEGEYIKVLASDDALEKTAISSMVDFFENNPDADIVVVNGVKISEEESYPNFTGEKSLYPVAPDFSADGFFERTARRNNISAPAAMIKRAVFLEYGFYDETVQVEDYEFWLRVLKEKRAVVKFLNKNLIFYRINENSITSLAGNKNLERRRKLMFESEIQSLYKYRDYFEKAEFAEIVLRRIFDARWIAVEMKLGDFCRELETMWKSSDLWGDLNKEDKKFLKWSYFKSTVKKFIRGV